MVNKNPGILYIVATPIGNLEDITFRAVRILEEVDVVLCEDTRVTHKLLEHYHLETKTMSYFQHSNLAKVDAIIKMLEEGTKMALVTDAGTPGISDPGQALIERIRCCHSGLDPESGKTILDPRGPRHVAMACKPEDDTECDIQIIPIPGPSALTASASVSGMIEKEFYFAGFLPKKKGRQTKFREFAKMEVPIVIYESAMRLERTLGDIKDYLGTSTEVFISREITKMFEEYWGGKISKVLNELDQHTMKGEIVLVIQRPRAKKKNENEDCSIE